VSLGAESVLQLGHLSCSKGPRSTPPSSLAKVSDEASSPFKFGKSGDVTTTAYIEDEFFVFPHAVSQGEAMEDQGTPVQVVQETEMLQTSATEVVDPAEDEKSLETLFTATVPIATTPRPPCHQQIKSGTTHFNSLIGIARRQACLTTPQCLYGRFCC
jgi:hypothetical protein